MLVRIEPNPDGPRLFLFERRAHHWHWGVGLVAAGVCLIVVDRQDVPGWPAWGSQTRTVRRRSVTARTPALAVPRFDPEIGTTTSNAGHGGW